MIKLIIFDIGGVIIDFAEDQYAEHLSNKYNISKQKIINFLMPMIAKLELDKLKVEDMEKIFSKKFKLSIDGMEWDYAYEKIAKTDKNVKKIINQLSKKYKVVLLTNISRSRYEVAKERFLKGVNSEHTFASCYLKLRKPDPRIYRVVLKAMKVKPSEAIFIDNEKDNVYGARKVGIKSIRFLNSKQLVMELKKLKVG